MTTSSTYCYIEKSPSPFSLSPPSPSSFPLLTLPVRTAPPTYLLPPTIHLLTLPVPTPPPTTHLLRQALQYEEAKGKADDVYTALSISYGDLGTDIAVGAQLLYSAHPEQGIVTFSILGFALMMQAVTAFFSRQGPAAIVAGLFGAKPLYDTYHSVAETPRRQGQHFDHDAILVTTHNLEVTFESVPLGLYTAVLVVQASAEERSTVQMLSVLASVLAIA